MCKDMQREQLQKQRFLAQERGQATTEGRFLPGDTRPGKQCLGFVKAVESQKASPSDTPTGNWVCYHCFQLPGLWHFLWYLQSINAHTYFCSSFPIQLSHGTSLARLCQQSCPLQTWTSLSLLCVLEVLLSRFLCENIS